MAKNVFQKKKRIAHFQHAVDNFTEGENENVSSGCLDYVSSIIQNMDSNFNSVHSSCSKDHAKINLSNINEQRDNSSYNHHVTSSSNEDFSQNPKNLSKSKKFSLSRKFPLMEKSQKILKQLKHNRSIPKPRAHLAALPKSPLKSKSVHNACKISNAKKKKQREKGIRKLKNNAHVSILDFPDVNKNFKMSKSKISKSSLKIESCKEFGNTEFKDSNIDATISGLCDVNVNNRSAGLSEEKNGVYNTESKDSKDDTTDSEYERFVEKNKRGLQKKVCKRQKYSVVKTSKRESRKKLNRLLRENISEECVSDKYGNADLVLSSKKTSSFKNQKFAHDALTEIKTSNVIIGESEPDLDVHDCTRDSSSESDALDNEVFIANRTQLSKKSVCSALLQSESWSATSGVLSDTILPNVNTCINKDLSETSHLTSNSIIPNKDSPGTFLSDRNHTNSRKTEPNNLSNLLVIDLCDSDDDCKNSMSHTLPAVFVPKEDKCKTTDVTNNLCVSEHDCTNVKLSEFHTVSIPKEEKCIITNVPQSVIQSDSEGSDLEVIKVISVFPKRSECMINNVVNNKEKCPVVQNCIKSNADDKHSNTENDNKAKSDDNKYDAVYMTNICYDFNQDKQIKTDHVSSDQCILLNNESRKQPDVLLDDYILKRTIKAENNFEDDIILDSVQTSVCNSTEMNDIFINSVKNEICSDKSLKMDMKCYQCQNHSDFLINIDKRNANVNEHSLKNLSSLEGGKCSTGCICSNSKINHEISSSGIYGRKEDFQQMKQMSMTHLLELYKKEFQAYQEIIRAEKSFEVSLKLIETHQAEKLKYIRILVQQYVGNNQNSSETSDSSMKEKGDKKDVMFKNQDIDTIKTLTGERSSVFSQIDLSNDTENSTSNAQKKDFFLSKNPPTSSLFQQSNVLASNVEKDKKPDKCKLVELQTVFQCGVKPKLDVESSLKDPNSSRYQSGEKQTLKLLKEKCNACGKEAMAACQRCAKVFFCSHECGRKFWNDGHENECGK